MAKGRRSEIDYMNGLISRRGVEARVPTPYNDAIVAVMHDIDEEAITPAPSVAARIVREARAP